jgi:BASS family bile acid:Na+ symporter
MNAARLIGLGINLSMALMVFGIALTAGGGRAKQALRDPALLLRSLVAMYVAMPVLAVAIALNFELNKPVLIALILLALAPVPPILPSKQIKAGGSTAYVLGLLVVSALAAIVVVPLGVELIGRIFGQDLDVPLAATARVVGISVLIPVVAGLAVARFAPAFAEKIAGLVAVASTVLLFVLLVPVLYATWGLVTAQAQHFTVLAILLFIAVGLVVGHLLGGPVPENRTALALATATRHPGVALAVMHAVMPEEKAVAPVVLLYLLVSVVASIPYVKWRQRVHGPPKSRSPNA